MALSGLRKGTEEIVKSAAGGGGGKFTPFLSWKDGDVKLLYFLTAAEDIPKLKLHNFVEIPYEDSDGNEATRYDTFVCRKDPAFREESGNTCDLCDRVGQAAVEKFVALAVELEPVKEGKKITSVQPVMRQFEDREGNDREVPQIGLVVQASRNFFAPYVAWESRKDLEETSFEVQREGASTDTKYYFFPVDSRPDLTDIEVPSLEDLIERMGSEEKYADVSDLKPGSQKSWGDKKGKGKGTSAKAQTGAATQGGDLSSQFERIKSEVKGKRGSDEGTEELESY